jgi:hypothetical protein
MILVKSHTATITQTSDAMDSDLIVVGLHRMTPTTVSGQLTPKDQVAAFEALGVETSRPHKFLYDAEDYGKLPIGAEVTFAEEPGEQFIVVGPERLHSVMNVASHCSVWLSKVLITPSGNGGGASGGSGS